MPAESRARVKAATVWIRAQLGDAESEGSGYVSKPGYVITNAQVVEGARSVQAVLNTGEGGVRSAPATVVRAGRPGTPNDIAVLKADTGDAPSLPLAFRIARAFNRRVEDVFQYDAPSPEQDASA